MSGRDVFGRGAVALPTAAEAAELDRAAQEDWGIPQLVLMENAGRAAALLLQRLYPRGRVVAAVGGGHNGGDAIVALRTLRSWGRDVAFVRASSRLPNPAPHHGFDLPEIQQADAPAAFAAAGVVVDGILGTGSAGAPREPAASLIRAVNASRRPVLALDLPSGVDADTGAVPGDVVLAEVTVSFGWPKLGLLLHPARSVCGRIVAVEIGFPPLPTDGVGAALITPAWADARLPRRSAHGHKGTSGRVLVLAGSSGMAGAAVIATEAAMRAGAGLVHVASTEDNRGILQSSVPEAIFRARAAAWADAGRGLDAALMGPGIGTDPEARRILDAAIAGTAGVPLVLDADALTHMAGRLDELRALAAARPVILTPHPGEMARLTGTAAEEIGRRPVDVARDFARDSGCVVLLKGQPSVVAAPPRPVLVNSAGSSDVATAGMGDQLGGTIAAMLAAGVPAREAASLGLFYSSRAADLAAQGRSLSPRAVSAHLHAAFDDPGARRPPGGFPFVTFDQPPRW